MPIRKNNRGKIEIMADILELSTSGIKKTHIMYKANLSYEQILYYLGELQTKGLIEQRMEDSITVYGTTEKGREFLNYFSQMSVLLTTEYSEPAAPVLTS